MSIRFYDVVPLAMKSIAHNINALHFFVADLASSRIFLPIQSTLDLESFLCRSLGDQVDNGFVINQRLCTPI
jgi:hypothetical protein